MPVEIEKRYRIGDFSELVGLNSPTLRYYEKEGLIKPHRTNSGVRYYTEQDARWVRFLLHLKSTGMTIEQLKRYVKLRAEGDSTINQRVELLEEVRRNFEVEFQQLQDSWTVLNDKLDWYKGKQKEKLTTVSNFPIIYRILIMVI
jgi:Predicted transcriptional regulators